jgi:hypothetical protein
MFLFDNNFYFLIKILVQVFSPKKTSQNVEKKSMVLTWPKPLDSDTLPIKEYSILINKKEVFKLFIISFFSFLFSFSLFPDASLVLSWERTTC